MSKAAPPVFTSIPMLSSMVDRQMGIKRTPYIELGAYQ